MRGQGCVGEPGVIRIILLSDGAANEGVVDQAELAHHAHELAKRGIVTSCVGIGNGYERLLLQAIAEHGGGRVHDAEFGADIVDVLMGELGEISDLVAQDVSITLHVPATAKAEFVGSAPVQVGAGLSASRQAAYSPEGRAVASFVSRSLPPEWTTPCCSA